MLNSMYSKKKLKLSISNINIIICIQLSCSSEGLRWAKNRYDFKFFFHEENEEENEL